MSFSEAEVDRSIQEYRLLHHLENHQSALDYVNAGWFYHLKMNDSNAAGRFFFRAVLKEPHCLHHRVELARFLANDNRLHQATSWWQRSLRLALKQKALPNELALIYLELAKVYRQMNRLERYSHFLHLSLKACPGYEPALRLLDLA